VNATGGFVMHQKRQIIVYIETCNKNVTLLTIEKGK